MIAISTAACFGAPKASGPSGHATAKPRSTPEQSFAETPSAADRETPRTADQIGATTASEPPVKPAPRKPRPRLPALSPDGKSIALRYEAGDAMGMRSWVSVCEIGAGKCDEYTLIATEDPTRDGDELDARIADFVPLPWTEVEHPEKRVLSRTSFDVGGVSVTTRGNRDVTLRARAANGLSGQLKLKGERYGYTQVIGATVVPADDPRWVYVNIAWLSDDMMGGADDWVVVPLVRMPKRIKGGKRLR